MKTIFFAVVILFVTCLACPHTSFGQDAPYERELLGVKVILTQTNPDLVKGWLANKNSGYPDLSEQLISLLGGCSPRGRETVLDVIMGQLKILNGRAPGEYLSPPFSPEQVKMAYVRAWIENNSGEWVGAGLKNQSDQAVFTYICGR
ncbi:MAG: hypothetical protein HQK59_13050 [Deltaproteobacteria bacterium]|nr:hypothetical protein [Deltaproteobacteria bacterium]